MHIHKHMHCRNAQAHTDMDQSILVSPIFLSSNSFSTYYAQYFAP